MTTLTTTLVDCPHCGRLTETDSAAHQEACRAEERKAALDVVPLEERLRRYRRSVTERVEVRG